MEAITECRIPLLWNANGCIEVIKQDDVTPDEAERFIKLFERNLSSDSDSILRPSSRSSNDLSSESDCTEKLSFESMEENSHDIEYNYEISLKKAMFKPSVESESKQISSRITNAVINKEDKVHVCDICGKRFSRKFNLNTHIKCVHSDDKDYVCSYCKRAFNHSSNLRKHIKTVHGTEKRLPCPVCKKPFKHPEALKNHVKVIHGMASKKDE